MKRKNYLVITSDQQRWNFLGKLNHLVKTPNLDKLAEDGMIFTESYTPSPTCTPARCSLLTGQYPSKHGAYTIGTALDPDYRGMAHEFSEAGYNTALIGKAHFRPCLTPGSLESAPKVFDFDFFKKWHGPYHGFEHVELVIGHTSQSHASGMHYGLWLEENGIDRKKYFELDGKKKYAEGDAWDLSEEYHPSRWTALRSNAFIDKSKAEDKPFLMWTSFQDPHNPYIAPEPWASLVNPDDIDLPEILPDEANNKPDWYKPYEDKKGATFPWYEDPFVNGYKSNLPHSTYKFIDNPQQIKKAIAVNMGMVALMDKYIGEIIDHLKEIGEYDNTLIVFTSDHGDYLGKHGLWFKGMHAYDDCQKIPFIVRHPEGKLKGAQSRALMNLVDIAPSFLNDAGIAEPRGMDGIDQIEVWKGGKEKRGWTMIEYRGGETPFMQKTFITDDYKLAVYKQRDYGELYLRKEDPDQKNNLWDHPDYQIVKCDLLFKMASAEMEKERVILPRTSGA